MASLQEVDFDPFASPKASTPADFATTYAPVAEKIGAKLGVDPKIILGQLGLETGWGKSIIPGTNNLGNIKDFAGGGVAATDNMNGSKDKYRAYKTVDDFANDYSSLIERKYPNALNAGSDPAKFTAGLKGYAEDPRYADKVAAASKMVGNAPGPVMNALGKAVGAVVPSANAKPRLEEVDFDPFAKQPTPMKGGGATGSFDAPSTLSRMDKIGRGLRDPIDGGAQLLTNVLPSGMVNAGNKLNNWLADKTGLVGRLPEGGVDAQVRQNEATYQAQRGPDAGFDGYRVLGNVLSPANLALASGAPAAASLAGRVGVGAGMGAASAAMNPVTSGDSFAEEKAKQIALGGAFGGAVPAVTGAIGRVISPNASTNANLQLLKNEGVQPTIGQSLGGWANRVEEKATSVPIMGDAISAARERARTQFNQAAINRAVAPIGEKVDEVGQAGIQKAGNLLSQAYDDAIDKVKFVKFDGQFAQDVGQLKSMAQNMTPEMAKRFNNTIDDVLTNRMSGNGSMLGATYKQVDSKLGQEAAKFSKSSDPLQAELGDAYKQLQSLLKQQAARSNPAFSEAIKKADAGWSNLVRVEGAGKAAINSEGFFTPGQLNAAVRQADQSVRGRAIGRGTALMQDLGNAGQQVLGNKVPNSGTADRLMLGAGGLSAGLINPAIPAALIGGAAMYTSPMQRLLTGMATARPQIAQPIRDSLLQTSPRLIPGAAQVGLGLLN